VFSRRPCRARTGGCRLGAHASACPALIQPWCRPAPTAIGPHGGARAGMRPGARLDAGAYEWSGASFLLPAAARPAVSRFF